jgi:hypothetical protein
MDYEEKTFHLIISNYFCCDASKYILGMFGVSSGFNINCFYYIYIIFRLEMTLVCFTNTNTFILIKYCVNSIRTCTWWRHAKLCFRSVSETMISSKTWWWIRTCPRATLQTHVTSYWTCTPMWPITPSAMNLKSNDNVLIYIE